MAYRRTVNMNGSRAVGSANRTAALTKTKKVRYGATSDKIFSISEAISASETTEIIPSTVEVKNTGLVPVMVIAGYEDWTADGTSADDVEYLHTMVLPGDTFSAPVRAVITSGGLGSAILDGTAVTNEAPNSNMYADIDTVGNAAFDVTTDPVSFDVTDGDFWRVGDMMRCQAEVVQITAISGNTVTVNRGMLGTSAAAHGDGETLRLQFSNDYHDIDKYSVCQTNADGRFKASNFFGKGRSASGTAGIVPGSVNIKFYNPGYQKLGLSGITSSTNSGLTLSDTYTIDITVDGGTLFESLSFTVDTTNANFGGTNGIISKIQSALDTQYYTAGNLFEKKVVVTIENGDIVFRSGQMVSGSAISLGDSGDSNALFDDSGKKGRFPIADVTSATGLGSSVPARLPDDVTYNPITYTPKPTNVICYDDGRGRLGGSCNGTINYETGAISLTRCPANAEFVFSCLENTAFSGKINTSDVGRKNCLMDIFATTPSQKAEGRIEIKAS